MYIRFIGICLVVAAMVFAYLKFSVVDKYGLTLAVSLPIIIGLWWMAERHIRAQSNLIDLLEKKAHSDKVTIDQFQQTVRRQGADLSQVTVTAHLRDAEIASLKQRLLDATSIPMHRHVPSHIAAADPTPPARVSALPGAGQNRVPPHERRGMGSHYQETIRDEADNGLGTFAMAALAGATLHSHAGDCQSPEPVTRSDPSPSYEPSDSGSYSDSSSSSSD